MKLSYIILTANDGIDKGNSIGHTLYMALSQTYTDFEVILVNNGMCDLSFLNNMSDWKDIKVIDIPTLVSRGKARNIGVSYATGDFLIFLDDDAILRSSNEIGKIVHYIEKGFQFGYGAIRHRTKPDWFQENSAKILADLQSNIDPFIGNLQESPKYIRGKEDTRLQNYSFISHLGFCNRNLFNEVGGFPDFDFYGFEDSALTFLLYKTGCKYVILSDCEVIHVTHELPYTDEKNIPYYYDFLIENDVIWFDISATFDKSNGGDHEFIEPLGVFHPDYNLIRAYNLYKSLVPAHMSVDHQNLQEWREGNQFSLLEYVQLYGILRNYTQIDSFIQNSKADLDDLIPFISSLLQSKIVVLKPDASMVHQLKFTYFPKYNIPLKETDIVPNASFNQFPCDKESKRKRLDLIFERYPYTDYLKMALIGDDDLVSNLLIMERWLHVYVIEKDPEVIKRIPSNRNCSIIEYDIGSLNDNMLNSYKISTFMTDPPYTVNGILSFIYTGLSMLDLDGSMREFYVVINPTILGKKNLLSIQKILSDIGVWIDEIRVGFSTYKLPEHFDENKRKDLFLKDTGVNSESVKYSSSSNLYIMRTIKPDVKKLKDQIDNSRLYNHFN